MNIKVVIFMALVTVTSSSCHPTPRHVLEPQLENGCRNRSATTPNYIAAAHRYTHSILRTRTKRSRSGKLSLSPESAPPPYIKPNNSTKTTNTTLPIQQSSSKIPFWFPTLEAIVTPIFRVVLLIITLFNVNITWRIHGQSQATSFMHR